MNIKYKLLFYLPTLASGGAERVTINIIRELNKTQFEVYLLVNTLENAAYIDMVPTDVKIINMKREKTITSIYNIFKVIKNIKPDLVYSTLFRSTVVLDLVLRVFFHKPYVLFRNPTSPKYIIENGNMSPILRFMVDVAYRRANLVLAQTPQMKDELITYHRLNDDQVEIIINPIDKITIEKSIQNQLNPFNISKINVVAAGRLHHDKGFDILLQAFQEVIAVDNRYHLTIIGNDVGEGEMLKELSAELKLLNHVDFLGFQKNPYKFFYFSDLYVLSSRVEGLPNTVLENLYLKKPIVATECTPFMHTLIEEKKSGFIIPVEDINTLSRAILKYKELELPEETLKKDMDMNQFFLDKVLKREG